MSEAPTLDGHVPQRTKPCAHCGVPFGADLCSSVLARRKVCGEACMHAAKKYNPEKARAMFWLRVKKLNGCWEYQGARDKWGYGDVNFLGKHIQAHRLAWRLLKGEPGELDVLHKCNNPPCCNPDHLYLGTDKENAADRLRAGTVIRGEQNHSAKLTADKVREIRALKGKALYRDIAEQYGISTHYVSQIVTRRTWKHVA